MSKSLVIATAVALAGMALGPCAPSVAAPMSTPCPTGIPVTSDFDGDGGADLLVGVHRSRQRTARVTPSDGGNTYWVDTAADGITSADLNGDTCADAVAQAQLFLGSPTGLGTTPAHTLVLPAGPPPRDDGEAGLIASAVGIRHHGISQVIVAGTFLSAYAYSESFIETFTLDSAGAPGSPVITKLGTLGYEGVTSLAGSGATVAVGVPFLTVGDRWDAGGVLIFSAADGDPTQLLHRATLTQNSPGIPGSAEKTDQFGGSLSMRDGHLAIGIPGETIGKARYTGSVQPLLWHEATSTFTAYRSIQQSTSGVVGTNETEDHFGTRVLVTRGLTGTDSYDIAIATDETVGRARDAGSVTVAHFSKAIYRTLTQNTRGVPGTAEKDDNFGRGLGALSTSTTSDTLLIGAAGERASSVDQVGYVVGSDGRKLSSSTKWTRLTPPAGTSDDYFEYWGYLFA